ncbi:E3 ubiquitin-protein ligase TRIM33-like isoform X2 [Mya arenaria]|uniref:E3 ubiquitin-protein ligase TRIM33-like isoform X2 n=1 Tax=Mya arenaria TaxID=6604 RepID=UPI0022E2D6A5|nr:E3 ubiquitin-protein ligase TRIM33-like isoform X2 [Mya arenaria]
MAEEFLNDLQNALEETSCTPALTCGKCKDEFSWEKPAKLLPCLHSFCEPCLKQNDQQPNLLEEKKDENTEEEKSEAPTEKNDMQPGTSESSSLSFLVGDELTEKDANEPCQTETERPLILENNIEPKDLQEGQPGEVSSSSTFDGTDGKSSFDGKSAFDDGKSTVDDGNSTFDGKLRCPECQLEYTEDKILQNPFVSVVKKFEPKIEDGAPTEDKKDICTSCDENEVATSFCVQCEEWLCDPCVGAHKRVKLTKDHTVTIRSEMNDVKEKMVIDTKPKQMYCEVHQLETLKLFCLTCEKLTCRDCQLEDHKDHNYQYIEKTVDGQKKILIDGIDNLKEKLQKHQEMAEQILSKEKDIKRQQVEVFNEVRRVADLITNELISWCKKLLNFLQGVCHGRIKDLTFKKKEIDTYGTKAKHIIEFVESALSSGDDLALLYTKSIMSKNISQLNDQEINFSKTLLDLNIQYENDAVFLTKNVSKMGFINVNGKSYPHQEESKTAQSLASRELVKAKIPSLPQPVSTEGQTVTNPVQSMTNAELLNTISKDNFQQHIIELLSREPLATREKYRALPPEKKRQFLENLLQSHKQLHLQQQQQQQQPAPSNQPVQQQQQQGFNPLGVSGPPQRQQAFSSDSGALQELYRQTQRMPAPPQAGFMNQNPFQRQQQIQQQQLQQQQLRQQQQQQQLARQRMMMQQQIRQQQLNQNTNAPFLTSPFGQPQSNSNFQSWRGAPASMPMNTNSKVIPANQLPSTGKYDFIDPLNLRGGSGEPTRVKQEPRDNPSCQFSGKATQQSPQPSNHGQPQAPAVPSSTSSSPSSTLRSPAHTPSPGHIDGGHMGNRSTASPAVLPDINIMDSDRSMAMTGLMHPNGHIISPYNLMPRHDPNDPSEDYCGVCHNGGDLLCCDRCPKVFHLNCHCPVISSNLSPSETWTCTMCTPDEELIIREPIPREFELTSTGKRKAPNGLVDREIRVCERILLELFCKEVSTVFHEPVSKSIPNYYKIITHPMDFGTIKCKLRRGHFAHYNSIEEYIRDVKLVFRNCMKFNDPISDVYGIGIQMNSFFETLVAHFLPCYLHCLTRSVSPDQMSDPGMDGPSRIKKRRSPAPDSTRDSSTPPI